MSDWTSSLGYVLGYAIAAAMLVVPIAALVLVYRSERFRRRRRRFRWAGERLVWWGDQMSDLGPLGEDPEVAKRRQRD